jgi:hypothetical protein
MRAIGRGKERSSEDLQWIRLRQVESGTGRVRGAIGSGFWGAIEEREGSVRRTARVEQLSKTSVDSKRRAGLHALPA